MSTSQPIRNKHQIREISEYYLKLGQIRNYVLVVMGIHTALRIGDLLRLKWDDVYDFDRGRIRESVVISEKKTGKTKTILLNGRIAAALNLYAHTAERGRPLILSRKGKNKAISRQHAHRIISNAAEALDFTHRVSCHSLRKTFGYLAWKSGISPAVIMKIYNHSSLAVTQRYLGVTQDDLDDCYRRLAELA